MRIPARMACAVIAVVYSSGYLGGCGFHNDLPQVSSALSLVPENLLYPKNPSGYTPLIPVRSDFGPGFVFVGRLGNNNDIVFSEVVCTNLYPQIQPRTSTLVLTNSTYDSKNNFGLSLGLLQKLIGNNTASLEAKYSKDVKFNVTLGAASETYLATEQLWNGAQSQKVDPACQNAIDRLKLHGKFDGSVFVVSRALTVEGLSYDFDRSTDASAKLTLELKNILNATPDASSSVHDTGKNTSVDVKALMHTGIHVDAVDEWEPDGAVSPGVARARIKTHALVGPYRVQAG